MLVAPSLGDRMRDESNWRQYRRSDPADYDDQSSMQRQPQQQRQYQKRNAGREDFYGRYSAPSEPVSSGGSDGQQSGSGNGQNEFGQLICTNNDLVYTSFESPQYNRPQVQPRIQQTTRVQHCAESCPRGESGQRCPSGRWSAGIASGQSATSRQGVAGGQGSGGGAGRQTIDCRAAGTRGARGRGRGAGGGFIAAASPGQCECGDASGSAGHHSSLCISNIWEKTNQECIL